MLLRECIGLYKSFEKLSGQPLPLKSSWMVAQNLNKLKAVVSTFDATRNKYIQALQSKATLDASGNPEVSEELAAEFEANIEKLLNEELRIRLKKVTLVDDGTITIEPAYLAAAADYLTFTNNGDKDS